MATIKISGKTYEIKEKGGLGKVIADENVPVPQLPEGIDVALDLLSKQPEPKAPTAKPKKPASKKAKPSVDDSAE